MTTNWCTLRYHHGGEFVRTKIVRYLNRMVEELEEDMDRICYWMFLRTIKYLGYDIKKHMKLFYLEGRKTLTYELKVLVSDSDCHTPNLRCDRPEANINLCLRSLAY